MIGLMVVLLTCFSHMVSMVLVLWGVGAILGMGLEFKEKNMLHCYRGMKCQQGFNTKIWY